jgi:hypothetical protein
MSPARPIPSREHAHSTPDEFARVIAREITKWKTMAKVGNIKVD